MGLKALESGGQKVDAMIKAQGEPLAERALEDSYVEEMKKDKEEADPIIVDEIEPPVDGQRNGEMSVGGEF